MYNFKLLNEEVIESGSGIHSINLLNDDVIEKLVAEAGFEFLEALAIQEAVNGGLTAIKGIGKKKAETIKSVLSENGIRYELTNEERFLEAIFGSGEEFFFLTCPLDKERIEVIHSVIATLSDKEQKVLILRFGLNGNKPMTLDGVAKEFNVPRDRIRQIEAKALRKLRHPNRSKRLVRLKMSRLELENEFAEKLAYVREANYELNRQLRIYKRKCSDMPLTIEDLELSTGTYNRLKKAGINTVEDAKNADLEKVRNLGMRGYKEVTEELKLF